MCASMFALNCFASFKRHSHPQVAAIVRFERLNTRQANSEIINVLGFMLNPLSDDRLNVEPRQSTLPDSVSTRRYVASPDERFPLYDNRVYRELSIKRLTTRKKQPDRTTVY